MRVDIAAGDSNFGVVFLSADANTGNGFRVPDLFKKKKYKYILTFRYFKNDLKHSDIFFSFLTAICCCVKVENVEPDLSSRHHKTRISFPKNISKSKKREDLLLFGPSARQKLSDVSDKMLTERERWSEPDDGSPVLMYSE